MERLLDHTLAQQMKTLERRLVNQEVAHKEASERQAAQLAHLAALLEKQLTLGAPQPTQSITIEGGRATVQAAAVINNSITIRPWGSPDRIYVTTSMLRAAFAENPRLLEYCGLDGPDQVDAETAAPYVLEALLDLVKRAHADPEARNVYLNPRRADQVLVYDEAWKVLSLVEAIRGLFDSTAQGIKRIILSDADRAQLSLEVQSAAAGIPFLYEDEAEKYVQKAQKQISAHLANTAPQKMLTRA